MAPGWFETVQPVQRCAWIILAYKLKASSSSNRLCYEGATVLIFFYDEIPGLIVGD